MMTHLLTFPSDFVGGSIGDPTVTIATDAPPSSLTRLAPSGRPTRHTCRGAGIRCPRIPSKCLKQQCPGGKQGSRRMQEGARKDEDGKVDDEEEKGHMMKMCHRELNGFEIK